MNNPIKHRYDFVILFGVKNGNPNGDPDTGNMPRMDPSNGLGIVTDVCIKRKIRNYVEAAKDDVPGYRIYVKERVPLERNDTEALKYFGLEALDKKEIKKEKKDLAVRDFMCRNFYDIRTFGAVMTTFVTKALNCGQVRGPVQLGMAQSIDPIAPQDITITRITRSTEKEAVDKVNAIGHKYIIPYALYRMEGYVSANLAKRITGFSEEDLNLLWEAIMNMFELDHSATRGNMATHKLIVFKHESELGNASSYDLFKRVHVKRKPGVVEACRYEDYDVTVDTANLPDGVTCEEKL